MFDQTRVDERYYESTQETLVGLYGKRNPVTGEPVENVADIINRVALSVAIAELKYCMKPEDILKLDLHQAKMHVQVREWAERFADNIGNQRFWANTPANINADPEISLKVLQYWALGTFAGLSEHEIWEESENFMKLADIYDETSEEPLSFRHTMGRLARELKGKGCLAACGVAYVDDSLEGIQETARIEAMAAKAAMGMGLNTSTLRPWSSVISNGAAASGPDRFYEKSISQAVEAVAQGGRRGGALIELRNSDHPDILFFIDKKKLTPPPTMAGIMAELTKKDASASKAELLKKAEQVFGERYANYVERQKYLRNTNVTVLAMPGFMEAVIAKQWYPAKFQDKPWDGAIYDPRRPELDAHGKIKVNKLTKEPIYGQYQIDLKKYPEAQQAALKHPHIHYQVSNTTLMVSGFFYAPDVFDRIIEGMRDSGEPGIAFYETVNKGNANPHIYDLNTCNPCFAPGTYVMTKEGHFRIEELVGKTVTIWDGDNWVEVDNFRVTAENQPILEIEMASGFTIKCTPYHKFILENGERIEAKDLQPGMRLQTHDKQVHGNHKEKAAYLKGFLIADGQNYEDRPQLWLYENKFGCGPRLQASAEELTANNRTTNTIQEVGFVYFNSNKMAVGGSTETYTRCQMSGLTARKEELFNWVSSYKERLPLDEMLNWSLKSKCKFIAGVMDGDGTAHDGEHDYGYQIWSVYKGWLKDFQLLLASIGVHSKISLGKAKGKTDFKDRGGICETRECWRLIISQFNSVELSKQVTFSRLKAFRYRTAKRGHQSRNKIIGIANGGIESKVYCCTVPTNHAFSLSQGIVSAQCGEQFLPAGPGKDGRYYMGNCNLSSMHAAHPDFWTKHGDYDFQKMRDVAYIQQRFMDNVTDVSWYPIPAQNMTARMERRNGGGFAGIAEFLSRQGVEFGSADGLSLVKELFQHYTDASVAASMQLASERGVYPLWQGSEFEREHLVVRNSCMTNNAPTGTLAQALQTSWGVDPHNGIVFSRKVRSRFVDFVAPGFKEMMQRLKAWPETQEGEDALIKRIRDNNKSCFGLSEVPQEVQDAYPIRVQVSPMAYIDHLAAIHDGAQQYPWAFNSVSNTCSIPLNSPAEKVAEATIRAWQLGVKDITFYPDGSRLSQPVEKIAAEDYERDSDLLSIIGHQERSTVSTERTAGQNYKIRVGAVDGFSTLHVSLNHEPEKPGKLIEVYARMGKAGAIEAGLFEAIGRLSSRFLQYAAEFGEVERSKVEEIIVKQLVGIQSGHPAFYQFPKTEKAMVVQSPCDGLAKAIQQYSYHYGCFKPGGRKQEQAIEVGEIPITGITCRECGANDVLKIDGCNVCQTCGFSKC